MNLEPYPTETGRRFLYKAPGVLVVDDDESVREVEKDILMQSGFKVYATGNVEKAINTFKENEEQIDLVITDYSISENNGKDVCDIIKNRDREMPVMLVSGTVGSLEKSELEGFARIMGKPFNLDEFSVTVLEPSFFVRRLNSYFKYNSFSKET